MLLRRLMTATVRPRHAAHRIIAVLLGVLSLQSGAGAQAQTPDYRSPEAAPAAWAQFAQLVKLRFEERIAADEPVANRFHAWLVESQGKSGGAPASLIVRAWLNADGTVDRVSFPALPDVRADDDLHAILMRGNVGKAPPSDLLQPLNLRFSLNLPT
jgi:hypothetical protein